MTGLPTVQVLLDDGTGTFPYDITSKVLIGPGIGFSRGRDNWQGGVTTSALSLALNNNDGRFSPGSTIIASPSPIKVDQKIRFKETINGTTYTRYTGYVKSWPVSWPAVIGSVSTVRLTATDAQARAERRTLRSVPEESIFASNPDVYFTLSEPTDSTNAGDTSGNQASPLVIAGRGRTPLEFGTATGPGTDAMTAVQFNGGEYLTSTAVFSVNGASTTASVICAFATTAAADAIFVGLGLYAPGLTSQEIIGMDSSGHVGTGVGATILSAGSYNDGLVHVAELAINGATMTLYVDGVSVGSGAAGAASLNLTVGIGLVGSLAHVATLPTASSAGTAAGHASAILTGDDGEAGTARITRLAGYAGLPVGTLDSSLTNVAFRDFTGSSAWDCIQEVADAEFGVAFINGSGNLTFHNRTRVPLKTSPDVTVVASSYVTADAEPTQDDQQIINYIEVTAAATEVPQLVHDAASETTHGRYPDSKTYLVRTDDEALDRANWIVANFAEPTTRFGTLTFNLYAMPAAVAAGLLTAVEINSWVRVNSTPSQMPGSTTVDLIVQGYAETLNGGLWQLACNVVAQSLFTPVWKLGTSALGVDTRLYV